MWVSVLVHELAHYFTLPRDIRVSRRVKIFVGPFQKCVSTLQFRHFDLSWTWLLPIGGYCNWQYPGVETRVQTRREIIKSALAGPMASLGCFYLQNFVIREILGYNIFSLKMSVMLNSISRGELAWSNTIVTVLIFSGFLNFGNFIGNLFPLENSDGWRILQTFKKEQIKGETAI